MKEIDKDTQDKYIDKWLDILKDCTPGDMVKAKDAILECYRVLNLDPPRKVFVVDSPVQGALLAHYIGDPEVTLADVERVISSNDYSSINDYDLSNFFAGTAEAYWVGYYDMLQEERGIVLPDGFNSLKTLCIHTSGMFTFSDCAIICRKATKRVVEDFQFHSYQGAAIEFADGTKIYVVNGSYRNKEEWIIESMPFRSKVGKLIHNKK